MASERDTDIVYEDKTHDGSNGVDSVDFKDEKPNKFDNKLETEAFEAEVPPYTPYAADEEGRGGIINNLETAEDIVTAIIHVEDDPTLNPWTFRMFFIGENKSCSST